MGSLNRIALSILAGAVGTFSIFAGPPGGGARPAPAGRVAGFSGPSRFPSTTVGLQSVTSGFTGINPGALSTRTGYGSSGYSSSGFSYGTSGYGLRYANGRRARGIPANYYVAPYFYPGLIYDANGYYQEGFDAGAPTYGGPDPAMDSLAASQGYLGQQIQQLSAQMDDLRNAQQGQQSTGTNYGQVAPAQQTPPEPQQPPVTLILKSGQQLQVKNYAVMSEVFWDFTSPIAKKIPMANIDIPASARATEAQGGEFPQISQ